MAKLPPRRTGNHLLDRLLPGEYQRLAPHLQGVSLPVKQVLCTARSPVDYVYFPTGGIVMRSRPSDTVSIAILRMTSELRNRNLSRNLSQRLRR